MKVISALALVCCFGAARAWAPAALEAALQEFVDAKASQYQASLAVIVGGHEVAVATKAAATPSSKFLLGSGTKPFVAVRVMQLAEAGALALDDPAATHVDPALATLTNETFASLFGKTAASVTIAQLLGMKSGVADFDVPRFDATVLAAGDAVHSPLEFVRYAATVAEPYENHFVCEPGSCINYSSTNYQLLGLVLLTHALKADPATTWQTLDVKKGLVPAGARFADLSFLATGAMDRHGLDTVGVSGKARTKIAEQDASILGWTCGNVLATSTAAARFFHDLLVAKTLVDADSLDAMTTFAPIDNGWGKYFISYGLGLMVQQTNPKGPYPPKLADDGAYVGHGGDTYGYLSEQGFYPTLNATIAAVANEDVEGDFVKNALACGAAKIVARITQGRDANLACA